MKSKLLPTTIWAIQAAVAMTLAILIGEFFHLERSYWAVLTSIFLISQTYGESLKKAFERIFMTILGGVVGTTLYFSMNHNTYILYITMIVVVFYMIFCMGHSFIWSAFFSTLFVVFLFAIIGDWDIHILEVRIYETIIGASTAVLSSVLIFPVKSNDQLQASVKSYIEKLTEIISLSFDIAFQHGDKRSISKNRDQLYKNFRELEEKYKTSRYEIFFMYAQKVKARVILNEFAVLMHYSTNLLEASAHISKAHFSEDLIAQFTTAKTLLLANLSHIMLLIQKTGSKTLLTSMQITLSEIKQNIINQLEQTSAEEGSYAMYSLSFAYYLEKLNEDLMIIEKQILKIQSS